jgi:hypothetical protein
VPGAASVADTAPAPFLPGGDLELLDLAGGLELLQPLAVPDAGGEAALAL